MFLRPPVRICRNISVGTVLSNSFVYHLLRILTLKRGCQPLVDIAFSRCLQSVIGCPNISACTPPNPPPRL